jgi:hypothetical protein
VEKVDRILDFKQICQQISTIMLTERAEFRKGQIVGTLDIC